MTEPAAAPAAPAGARARDAPAAARRAAPGRLRRAARGRRARRLRQPGRCPACCASAASTAATRRSRPSWPTARCAAAARTTRCSPPASTGRWTRSTRRCSTCCGSAPTSCSAMRVPAARRGRRDRRAGPRGGRRGPRRVRQRRAAPGRPSTTSTAGSTEVAPADDDDPVGHLAVVALAPAVGRRARCATPSAARCDRRPPALLAADNVAAGGHLVARPGRADRRRAGRRPGAAPGRWSPYAARAAGRRPRRARRRSATAGPACRTRAASWSRSPWPRRPLDGPRRALARPVRRARRQGGAARRRSRPERGAALLAAEVAPHRAGLVAQRAGAATRPSVVVADGDGRRPWRAGSLRPGAGRRAVHRAGRAAPPARGALAAPAGGRRRPAPAAARRCSAPALDAVRPGGVVAYVTCSPHLAETRSVVERRAAPARGAGRSSAVDARPLLPGVPDLGDGPDVQLWPHRARHRRDVPRPAASDRLTAAVRSLDSRGHGRPDHPEHPVRRLRQPGRARSPGSRRRPTGCTST